MRIKILSLFLTLIFVSCSAGPAASEVTVTPGPSDTPVPTAGPAATLPAPLVILVLPADMNAQKSQDYQTLVYNLAQTAGYRFQLLNKLTSADLALEPNLKVVIALPPDPGIVDLAAAAPGAQFLAVNIPDIKPGGNVSTLGGKEPPIDKVAFMAGYIAAMITDDFRTGVVLHKDSSDSDAIASAFGAGQMFYCGLCHPALPPYVDYPQSTLIPSDAKPAEYTAYADLLIRQGVQTIFLPPTLDTPELLQYLPTVGVLMIGTESPTTNVSGWLLTLQPDYLEDVKAAWPDLIGGKGGQAFAAPLALTDVNSDLLSEGKQRLAKQTLSDLLADKISTAPKQP